MPNTKYVLPTAQTQRVTLNGGIPMPSWFDLYGLDDTAKDDVEGIKRAVERITRIIESEIANGVPTARIVVGGFSQGGAVALSTAFGFERKLAGVLGMSTWLPNAVRKGEVSAALRETPVLMCHGDRDATVPLKWAKISVEALRELTVQCELKTYANMAHSTSTEELADVRRFVKECLP
jgi:predicted esterase